MSRWEPGARRRFEQAALELFLERGYDETTVADIAERARSTQRTFFRHFGDKREVLFGDRATFNTPFTKAIAAAAADATPLAAIQAAVEAGSELVAGRHTQVKRRQEVIDAHPALQERDLSKLAALTTAMAEALRERGIDERTADIAAEAGMVVFKTAFARWLRGGSDKELQVVVREQFAALKAAVSG